MPSIPPVLPDSKLVSSFKAKHELCNSHFATQCTRVKNASTFSKVKYRTDKRSNSFTINEYDIFLIIKILNADTAYGCEWSSSIRMIQLCRKEIVWPLQSLFKSMLQEGIFLEDWKKVPVEYWNVVPVYKKENKNVIKSYCSISLLPIFSKTFERLTFNIFFKYLMEMNFLRSVCQISYLVTHALHNSCQLQIKSRKFRL